MASLSGKKRRHSASNAVTMCFFCGKLPAAVSVEMKSTRRKAKPTAFCMEHYYSTSAVRQEQVSVIDEELVKEQLQDGVQRAFSQAYTEIQQELAHESARAFQQGDPLAIVGELRGKPKPKKKKAESLAQGGFMRKVPLPERLLRTQQEQARLQREQTARMSAAASKSDTNQREANPYERRKPSRKSIWHIAMQEPTKEEAQLLASGRQESSDKPNQVPGVTCSCGSTKVVSAGNIQNRSSEMTKGETWGSKDRGESVVSRYQCETCGRIWNQED